MARGHFQVACSPAGADAFAGELFVRELREYRHRLCVPPLGSTPALREGRPRAPRHASHSGWALHVFCPPVAFGRGDVAEQFAQREFSFGIGPVHFVWRDATRRAQGARPDIVEIARRRLNGDDFP
jgi:hypothetical protein